MLLWFSGPKFTPFYHPLSPAPRFPACLPPVALHNCSESPFFKGTLWFQAQRNDIITIECPQLHNQSLSGHSERQSLPQSHCDRCAHSSIEERARGSRLTTIGRVVQSKTPEPEMISVQYGRVEPAGQCVCVLTECFMGFVLAKLDLYRSSV